MNQEKKYYLFIELLIGISLIIVLVCSWSSCNNDTEDPVPACSDGIDNDNDGYTDMDDPGCTSPEDDDEENIWPQCSDGIDNDGDGYTDLDDEGCESSEDEDEYNCIPEQTEFGYCPLDHPNEGLWQAYEKGRHVCTCTMEEMEEWAQTKEVPNCCEWTEVRTDGEDPELYGYVSITPRDSTRGALIVHTVYESWQAGYPPFGEILFGQYEMQEDGFWYIKKGFVMTRSFWEGEKTISRAFGPGHYQVEYYSENNHLLLEISSAFPQPLFDEKPNGFIPFATVKAKYVGEVGTCMPDYEINNLEYGYCYRGPGCSKLLAGSIPLFLCEELIEGMNFMFGSWHPQGDKEGCREL